MARQKGIIKIEGTLDDLTFYKSQDGNLVRTKTSLNGDRIKNDPNFIRTRENGKEFGSAAGSGKLMRDAFRTIMATASDNRVTSRLTRVMTAIKNFDTVSKRGDRVVWQGITNAQAKALLKEFNFNNRSILASVLLQSFALDTVTGIVTINNLIPINDIVFPEGATHFTLKSAWGKIDFKGGIYDVQESNAVNLPIDQTSTNVVLTPVAVPVGGGTDIFLLRVEFFQKVNAVQYDLRNGAFNALQIIDVP